MRITPEHISTLLNIVLILFTCATIYLLYQSRIILKKIEAKKYINRLEKETEFFNEENLYSAIYETFETLQKAASEKRLDIAKEYMTESGFDAWSIPLNWAIYNNERIKLHETKISYCWIVAIHADINKEDYFWVYLQGYHDNQPFIVTEDDGSTSAPGIRRTDYRGRVSRIINNEFQEYWKFVRNGDQFYLDEIVSRQNMKIHDLKSSINL